MTDDRSTGASGDAQDPTAPVQVPEGDHTEAAPHVAQAPVEETTTARAPVWPVRPVTMNRRPGVRWLVAVVATVIVVGAAAGAMLVMTHGSTSPVLGYVPANAVVFMEARLDTPGTQGEALASFLAHFPGFKDTSSLQVKLSDTWDRLFRALSGDRYAYSTDVAPWAEGAVGIAVLEPKTASPTKASDVPVILYVAVKDQAKAQGEVEKLVGDAANAGATVSSSPVVGAQSWTIVAKGSTGTVTSVALLDGMLLVTDDPALVGTTQDVKAGKAPSLASQQAYVDATASAPSDRLASVYVGFGSLRSELETQLKAQASAIPSGLLDAIPSGGFGTLRADSDRLTADFRATLPSVPAAGSASRASQLLDHVPGTTLAYVEVHDLGKGLAQGITTIKKAIASASPGTAGTTAGPSLDQIEGLLGGNLESFASWIGDAAIAVGAPPAGSQIPSVAFVATTTDEAAARQKLGQLRALISMATLAGGQTGGIAISDTPHGSATITTLEVPRSLLSGASTGTAGGGTSGSVGISWALADGRFVLAASKEIVGEYLDLGPGQGLGAAPAVKDALEAAGGPAFSSFVYVDLKATRAAAEAAIPSAQIGSYRSDVEPYLVPFDRFVALSSLNGSTATERAVVTVSNP